MTVPKRKSTPLWKSSPVKMVCLCCFGVMVPVLCIVVPVYARYILYADSIVTFAASDMRLVDSHISTAWCQVIGQEKRIEFPHSSSTLDQLCKK